jgi:putative NADH-flavin reductase
VNLLVFGATGPTGQHIVAQALEQGHDVTALARHPDRLAARSPRLHLVAASVPDAPQAVSDAVRGKDAVISALGVGQSFNARGLIAGSARVIVSGMQRARLRRLIFISAIGVGHTYPLPLPMAIFTRTLLRGIYADKKVGEDVIRASDLDWTLVHPTMLTNGPRTGRYRVGERLPFGGMPKVARADVAHFVLSQLNDSSYLRKTVLVSY